MSKINAVRFINLNYNYDAIRISDETMHFGGESTLIKLDNGGGKSVLVQMMTAPFVHKRYRNTKDRPFSSFFTSGKPTFILVEWALDKSAGYVMAGMMVRKNQNPEEGNEEELEIVNIISEYREPCMQDIHHLPVIEKTDDQVILKNFGACRQLFDSYKKDRSLRFFSYDMGNSAQNRQYFSKLMEYGIDSREWENIIRKVNEEESGLSKLFADCKDERGLIEKWFLDTIENKLNRDHNRMQGFREIVEKYIASYQRNQSKIKQKDTILHFEQEAGKIREQAEAFRESSTSCAKKRGEIAAFISQLRSLLDNVSQERINEEAYIEEVKENIRRTDHERLSAGYYSEQEKLTAIEERITRLQEQITETDNKKEEWERRLNLLLLAEKQELTDSARADYQEAVQALDICRKKGEDLQPERGYIGYLLHQYYDGLLSSLKEKLAEINVSIREHTQTREKAEEQIDQLEISIRKAEQENGRLAASIKLYDQEEQRFFELWKVDLNRNLMGEYDAGYLQILTDQLENERTEGAKDRSAKRKQHEQTEITIRKQEQALIRKEEAREKAASELRDRENLLSHYEEELHYRRIILQYLELREDALFDKDRILRAADSKIRELEILIEKTGLEANQINEEIHNLKTGSTAPLSPELQKMLESLGINIVYGMEWMKRNGKSEKENLAFVDRIPFLPYALLMTESEFRRLSDAALPIYTEAPVPIVTRECLATDHSDKNTMQDMPPGVHFYMMFNRNLLNEEKLAELLDQKRRNLEYKKEELERKRREYREYVERSRIISNQDVSKDNYEDIKESISELREGLVKIRTAYAEISEQLSELRKTDAVLTKEIDSLTAKLDEMDRKKEDLLHLSQAYETYLLQKKNLEACKKKLADLDADKNRMQARRRQLDAQIQVERDRHAELVSQEKEIKEKASVYQTYPKAAEPEGFQAGLRADHAALIARYAAITESISREVKDLEAAQKKAAANLEKAEKALSHLASKHQIRPDEWSDIHYSIAEADHAEAEIENLRRDHDLEAGKIHAAELRHTETKKNLEHVLSDMQRECAEKTPVPREEIHSIDYAGKKNILLNEKSQHEKEVSRLKEQANVLNASLEGLSEYQDIPVSASVRFKEDFSRFSAADFRAFTGSLKRDYRTLENEVSEKQSHLEKVIGQIMRMDDFKDDYFKRPLETFSALSSDAEQVLKQLDIILQSYHDQMEKLMVDIALIDQERAHVIAALKEYASELHAQMGKIDKNSSVLVRGRPIRMLRISLPSWEENDNIYQRRMEDLVDDITNKGIALLEKGDAIHEFVGKRLTTRELYDNIVGIGNVHIQLHKIEAQRELPISWSEVARNSGGEGFLSAFIVLSSLLYYMRRDDTDIFADRDEGKVLLMDNPFAQTNAAHLLKPMVEVARKNNTQLICLTGLSGESIYNRFDNIYVLELVASALSNIQYLRSEHKKGTEPETLNFARIDVTDYEQMEMLF